MATPQPPLLDLDGFCLGVPRSRGDAWLLRDVDLRVPAGGLYLMVGPSGSGKSTLLRLATGLRHPREPKPRAKGRVGLLGVPLVPGASGLPRALVGRVSAVLQDEGLLDELTPKQNVELALRAAGRSPRLALALLAQVGLDPPPTAVHTLSGGMRKRLAVARSLAAEPDLLVLDEPTAGLDPEGARRMAELLADVARRTPHRTVVVVTHDLPPFEGLVDGALILDPVRRQLDLEQHPMGATAPIAARLQAISASAREAGAKGNGPPAPEFDRFLPTGWFGDLVFALGETLVHLPSAEPKRLGREFRRCITSPTAFTVLGCTILGALATFFALRNNPLHGAFRTEVLSGTGKVLASVLIPLVAGFFYTARTASDAAARLSAMQRTRQLDALTLLGVPPARWLLGPMAWGMTLGLPIVTAAAVVGASMGSFLAALLVADLAPFAWAHAFTGALDARDVVAGLLKTLASAWVVAATTWSLATSPKPSGAAVGEAASGAIVVGMAGVLTVHAVGVLAQFA